MAICLRASSRFKSLNLLIKSTYHHRRGEESGLGSFIDIVRWRNTGSGSKKIKFRAVRKRPWRKFAMEISDPWHGIFNSAEDVARAYDATARKLRDTVGEDSREGDQRLASEYGCLISYAYSLLLPLHSSNCLVSYSS